MSIPYKQTELGNNRYIREFSSDVNNHELEWHLDREDRIVQVIQNDGWMFQLDNQLPRVMTGTFIVPKETYHRIFKGHGDLIIEIIKL